MHVIEWLVDLHLELTLENFRVLELSLQGVFLVVALGVLVGIRTSPFTLGDKSRFISFVSLIKSAHPFSREFYPVAV